MRIGRCCDWFRINAEGSRLGVLAGFEGFRGIGLQKNRELGGLAC